ncbi:MAG: cyclic nucleotide-binding domain-containing protein, partial [Deltaproteobacteria bacterium]|nr:cyclic nucleotide-binding domain-containing protein [Deltaproteobacteria bacterium]
QAFFGELALLDEDKRSATIRTATDTEMLVLTRADFIRMGNDYPEIGLLVTRSLASIICKRFRSTNNDVILLFEALVNEIRSEELA